MKRMQCSGDARWSFHTRARGGSRAISRHGLDKRIEGQGEEWQGCAEEAGGEGLLDRRSDDLQLRRRVEPL